MVLNYHEMITIMIVMFLIIATQGEVNIGLLIVLMYGNFQ